MDLFEISTDERSFTRLLNHGNEYISVLDDTLNFTVGTVLIIREEILKGYEFPKFTGRKLTAKIVSVIRSFGCEQNMYPSPPFVYVYELNVLPMSFFYQTEYSDDK
ncbi:hypothetical protein KKJ06_12415 [Xenorhabdus bovienii]|uniref:hypothetical protein n=1 Tax=Xenorhabdus bovienii TaxID=40576 RepID=UPI0023B223BC|nr:hypothetical protein [Xenorhabdus bovienii]MDE9556211.1 hypothetical protein [Xenorhabdus bovienii]